MSAARLGVERRRRGANVHIPYEQCPVDDRRVRSWAATELNECIYILATGSSSQTRSGRCRTCTKSSTARSDVISSGPSDPDEKQFFGRDSGTSAVGRREHRRRAALTGSYIAFH